MTPFLAIAFGAFGAILASFTAVIVERVHTGQAWWKGRSRCNSCRRELGVLDLVPVLSWAMTFGHCRTCYARIPVAYTLFELALGALFALSFLKLGPTLASVVFLAFLAVLGYVVLYDLRHTIVPLGPTIALILLGFLFSWLSMPFATPFLYTIGVAFVIAIGFLLLFVVTRGRGMGLGDSPMSFAVSLVLGYQYAVAGLLFSFWIGAAVGIALLVTKHRGTTMKSEIPFVPFLAAGYLLVFFTGWNPLALTL